MFSRNPVGKNWKTFRGPAKCLQKNVGKSEKNISGCWLQNFGTKTDTDRSFENWRKLKKLKETEEN